MAPKATPVSQLMRLRREPVDPIIGETYTEIGIRSFGRGVFHKPPVDGAVIAGKRVFRIRSGDLLLSNVFAWEGAVAVATEEDDVCIGSHRFLTYEVNQECGDARFLRYFFLSERGLQLLRRASPGSAGRNRTLAIERFEALTIPLPDLDEQRRVADRLDSALAHLEVPPLAAPNANSANLLPHLIDTAVAGQERTSVRAVAELADIVSDVVRPGEDLEGARTFVGLEHIESHTGRRIGARPVGAEQGRKLRFQGGDVLYGYLRPYLNKVWVADRRGLCSVEQYVLRPKADVDPQLLAHVLRSASFLRIARDLTHNLQLPRLRSGLLLSAEVQWPRDQEAARGRADEIRAHVVALGDLQSERRRLLAALRVSLLNHAFAGLL